MGTVGEFAEVHAVDVEEVEVIAHHVVDAFGVGAAGDDGVVDLHSIGEGDGDTVFVVDGDGEFYAVRTGSFYFGQVEYYAAVVGALLEVAGGGDGELGG